MFLFNVLVFFILYTYWKVNGFAKNINDRIIVIAFLQVVTEKKNQYLYLWFKHDMYRKQCTSVSLKLVAVKITCLNSIKEYLDFKSIFPSVAYNYYCLILWTIKKWPLSIYQLFCLSLNCINLLINVEKKTYK